MFVSNLAFIRMGSLTDFSFSCQICCLSSLSQQHLWYCSLLVVSHVTDDHDYDNDPFHGYDDCDNYEDENFIVDSYV